MADFKLALNKVNISEGGYVNDPDDAGGETYRGISRKHNPKLNMWSYVDKVKKDLTVKQINATLIIHEGVQNEIDEVYKSKYWDTIHLDLLDSQILAEQCFDMSVNAGVSKAKQLLYSCCGVKYATIDIKTLIEKLNNNEF